MYNHNLTREAAVSAGDPDVLLAVTGLPGRPGRPLTVQQRPLGTGTTDITDVGHVRHLHVWVAKSMIQFSIRNQYYRYMCIILEEIMQC